MATTVVGIFDTLARAQNGVRELNAAGFGSDQVSLVHNPAFLNEGAAAVADRMDPDAAAARTGVTPDWGMASAGAADSAATLSAVDADSDALVSMNDMGPASGAVAGAGTGMVIGGGVGVLAGAVGLFIPGLGPILGMGPMLATILGGAGIGAVAGGLSGVLVNGGVPDSEAGLYVEGVRRGGTLLTIVADDQEAGDLAADILDRAGAYDINERAATWTEATAPVGGNVQVPALSTLPESSMTADVPVLHA
jgi:hypothetical protein